MQLNSKCNAKLYVHNDSALRIRKLLNPYYDELTYEPHGLDFERHIYDEIKKNIRHTKMNTINFLKSSEPLTNLTMDDIELLLTDFRTQKEQSSAKTKSISTSTFEEEELVTKMEIALYYIVHDDQLIYETDHLRTLFMYPLDDNRQVLDVRLKIDTSNPEIRNALQMGMTITEKYVPLNHLQSIFTTKALQPSDIKCIMGQLAFAIYNLQMNGITHNALADGKNIYICIEAEPVTIISYDAIQEHIYKTESRYICKLINFEKAQHNREHNRYYERKPTYPEPPHTHAFDFVSIVQFTKQYKNILNARFRRNNPYRDEFMNAEQTLLSDTSSEERTVRKRYTNELLLALKGQGYQNSNHDMHMEMYERAFMIDMINPGEIIKFLFADAPNMHININQDITKDKTDELTTFLTRYTKKIKYAILTDNLQHIQSFQNILAMSTQKSSRFRFLNPSEYLTIA